MNIKFGIQNVPQLDCFIVTEDNDHAYTFETNFNNLRVHSNEGETIFISTALQAETS